MLSDQDELLASHLQAATDDGPERGRMPAVGLVLAGVYFLGLLYLGGRLMGARYYWVLGLAAGVFVLAGIGIWVDSRRYRSKQ